MYVLKKSLFSYESWLEIEPSERLELFFSALVLHPYAAIIRSQELGYQVRYVWQ
ncbi:hypothetical protein [Alicyclobacillus fastidiosus]|uniref:hypothetical protein n=1 Tax=Alicyclobacillus fastidiosus TaxID=392011 RepID=UPI002DD41EDD|nr:hypothetical protein [Alicyclobacillus fastidiosus]